MNKYLLWLLFLILFGMACSEQDKKIPEFNVSEPCEVGTRKCSGPFVVSCVSTGRWETTVYCDLGCALGRCNEEEVPPGDECEEGEEGDALCNDGHLCNGEEKCENGYCVSGTPAAANTECDDGNACTENDSCLLDENNQMVCLGEAKDGACDDGNECTTDDACTTAGACVGVPVTDGTECDKDGNICNGTKICTFGECKIDPDSLPPEGDIWPDGTLCDDGDVCNGTGICDAGECKSITQNLADGTSCDDGNICNGIEVCQGSACKAVDPVPSGTPCDRNDGCSASGYCDGHGECILVDVAPDGTSCDDGNDCTTGETCKIGICKDGNSDGTDGNTCDDGKACTGDGVCSSGTCFNAQPIDDGTACNDSNPCTESGSCLNGFCMMGQILPNNTSCEDGNWCNGDEKCIDGVCNFYPDATRVNQSCDVDDEPCNGSEYCTEDGLCVHNISPEFGVACELPTGFDKPEDFTRERDMGQCFYETCMYCGWTKEPLYGGSKGRNGLKVLTDSVGDTHIFYIDGASKALMHRSRGSNGIWGEEPVISFEEDNGSIRYPRLSSDPKILVDSQNNFHVFYYDRDEKGLYYITDKNGYWGVDEPQLLQTIGAKNFYNYEVAIDLQSTINKLWLVFEDPSFGVVYMTKTESGTWIGGGENYKVFNYEDNWAKPSWPLSIAINNVGSLLVSFVELTPGTNPTKYRLVYAIDPQGLASFTDPASGRFNLSELGNGTSLYRKVKVVPGKSGATAIFLSESTGTALETKLEFVTSDLSQCGAAVDLPLALTHLAGGFDALHIENNGFGVVAFDENRYGYFTLDVNDNTCDVRVDGTFERSWAKAAQRVSLSMQPQTNPPLSFRGPQVVSLTDDYQVINHHYEDSLDQWNSYTPVETLFNETVAMAYDGEGTLHRIISESDLNSGMKDLFYSDSDVWPPQGGAQTVVEDASDEYLEKMDLIVREDGTSYYVWEDTANHKIMMLDVEGATIPWSADDAVEINKDGWALSQSYMPGNFVMHGEGDEQRIAYTYGSGMFVNMGYGSESQVEYTELSEPGNGLTDVVTTVNVWEDDFSAFVARKMASGATYSLEYFEKTDNGYVVSSVWVNASDYNVDIRQLFHWNAAGEGWLNLLILGVGVESGAKNDWVLHHWQRKNGTWTCLTEDAPLRIEDVNTDDDRILGYRVIGALDENLAPHFIAQRTNDPDVWTYFNYASNALWFTFSYLDDLGVSVYEVPELAEPMPTDGSHPTYPRMVVRKHGDMTVETMDDDYTVWRVRYQCVPVR